MKKLFLHIGTHKTGTTAIQNFAFANAERLLEMGILYPRTGRPCLNGIQTGHHLLPWTQTKHAEWKAPWGAYQSNPQTIWANLRSEIQESTASVAIVSSEEFDVLGAEQIGIVAEALDGFDVSVVCYLRRLDEFVQAQYATDVVFHRETRQIEDYLNHMRTTTDYCELINRWRSFFGERKVGVHFYLRSTLKDNDIVIDFFDRCGHDVADLREYNEPQSVNARSEPRHVIDLICMLNRANAPRKVVELFRRIASRARQEPVSGYDLLSPKKAAELADLGVRRIERLNIAGFTPEVRSAFLTSPRRDQEHWERYAGAPFAPLRRCLEEIEAALEGDRGK